MGVGRGVAGVVVGTESLDFRLGDVLGRVLFAWFAHSLGGDDL
jgi:hypothetical protein